MIICTNFKENPRGALVGFADLYIDKWNLHILGCSLFAKNDESWIGLPCRKYIDENGNERYTQALRFEDKKYLDAFIHHAKIAIEKFRKSDREI